MDENWLLIRWGGNAVWLRSQTREDRAAIAAMQADGRLSMVRGVWTMRLPAAGVINMLQNRVREEVRR
jgi:hypothetical protein